eukprot:GHVQ01009823.1.p1 GENE.GHVQ01009823.1~~GHVQ01009823.1.p1  ORF type:complete len:128 (+),score=4.18 GHVQ01009823.1:123-506(+)
MILGDLYGAGVLCYIDDIIIWGDTFDEFFQRVSDVLRRLTNGGVYLEMKKCSIGVSEVDLLGHVVSINGIMPSASKVLAIQTAQAPRDKAELRSFLGLAGYLRRFIPHFSSHTCAMSELLNKGVSYI